MDRAEKQDAIEALKGVFASSGAVVVTHYMGLTVAEMTDLRGRLRQQGAKLTVVKNTLAKKALIVLGVLGRARLCAGRRLRRQGRDPVRQGQ
jgi:ribosomal protein L10